MKKYLNELEKGDDVFFFIYESNDFDNLSWAGKANVVSVFCSRGWRNIEIDIENAIPEFISHPSTITLKTVSNDSSWKTSITGINNDVKAVFFMEDESFEDALKKGIKGALLKASYEKRRVKQFASLLGVCVLEF